MSCFAVFRAIRGICLWECDPEETGRAHREDKTRGNWLGSWFTMLKELNVTHKSTKIAIIICYSRSVKRVKTVGNTTQAGTRTEKGHWHNYWRYDCVFDTLMIKLTSLHDDHSACVTVIMLSISPIINRCYSPGTIHAHLLYKEPCLHSEGTSILSPAWIQWDQDNTTTSCIQATNSSHWRILH